MYKSFYFTILLFFVGGSSLFGQFITPCTSSFDNYLNEQLCSIYLGQQSSADGRGSVSIGLNTDAQGDYSTALGMRTLALGRNSFSLGRESFVRGHSSFSFGEYNKVLSESAIALGMKVSLSGDSCVAIGQSISLGGGSSQAFGTLIKSRRRNTLTIGTGYNHIDRLENDIEGSFMLGMNSNLPSILIKSGKIDTAGFVGINTKNPRHQLDVNGNLMISGNKSSLLFARRNSRDWGAAWGIEYWNDDDGISGLNFFVPWKTESPDPNIGINYYLFLSDKKGFVGVGTGKPTERLHVNGNIKSEGFVHANGYIRVQTAEGEDRMVLDDQGDYLHSNSPQKFFAINHPAEVRIGASSNRRVGQISCKQDGVSINTGLSVKGEIHCSKVRVGRSVRGGADFVFEEEYQLRPLLEVEAFVKENKHLPEIASEIEMKAKGVDMGDFQIQLLQKIEEMTLYMIELEKKNIILEKEIEAIKATIQK